MSHETTSPALIYELLFETATEGLIVADRHGIIELANKRIHDIFGYEHKSLIGKNVDDLLPAHLRQSHIGHRESYAKNPHSRPMGLGYELIGVRKDGTSVPVEISLNYFKNGADLKVMALIMDVTTRKSAEAEIKILNKNLEKRVKQRTKELKESQQLYSLIARNFPNGTINVFDKNFNYIFLEGEDLYRYGITSDRLMGKSYIKQLPEEVRPMMEERLALVLEGKNQSFEVEIKGLHYMINAVGLENQQGRPDRILLVEQNITERKKAEERVQAALEKEKQLNELKSRFVSMASHEFRTPLSTVLSSLSLIAKYDNPDDGEKNEKREKHYKRIRGSVRHLTGILNDFLSIDKVETGKVTVNPSQFNLKELLGDLSEQMSEITKTDQEIIYTYSGDEEFNVDQNMLRIIVTNLLSNAVKYSNEGKSIWLSAVNDDNTLTISVRDQGIGIPYEDQQNMFERFFRAKNAVNLEGTGLGLNIVKRYLQLLGGEISFVSVPDEGTTFTIKMPNIET